MKNQPQLSLLGGFALRVNGTRVALSPQLQHLLAFVALSETPIPRDFVVGVLWGDSSESRGHGSLRSALWKLRTGSFQIVEVCSDSLQLSPDVLVDYRQARDLASRVIAGDFSDDPLELLDPVLVSELLPGWYEDWILIQRERHRQLTLHALEVLCLHLCSTGQFGTGILAGLAAIERDPLRESAYRALMQVHLAEMNIVEAIRVYQKYATIASRELGVSPSSAIQSLLHHECPTASDCRCPPVALLKSMELQRECL